MAIWQNDFTFNPYFKPVLGRSMLWRALDRVVALGYDEIYLLKNKKAKSVIDHLKKGSPWGVKIKIISESRVKNKMDVFEPKWQSAYNYFLDIKNILCDGGRKYDLDPSWCDSPGVWVNNGCEIPKSSKLIPPVYLGEGVVLGEDVCIGPFVTIEKNACVMDGCKITNSYLGEQTVLKSNIVLENVLLHKNKLCDFKRSVIINAPEDVSVDQALPFLTYVQ